ncbi:MAG: PorT family protein [Marinilabiliaceae bacterium]|nr:PorT family protein [Marinilabiliaceae bacterium]
MKLKLLFCAAALLAVSIVTNAQTKFGVVAGVNINKIRIEKESLDPKAGFHLGVLLDKELIGPIHIQPSILFTQKGAKQDLGVAETKIKMNYLQIPIEASLRLPLGPIKLAINAGPYFAWGLNGKMETEGESGLGKVKVTYENIFKGKDGEDPLYKRFDTGLRLGAGVHMLEHLAVNLYYDLGFVKLDKESIADEFASKNGSFLISASFVF